MILLKSMRLINWYGFSDVTIPIGFFSLIAGKNGNGKSVLLDAIKYALYGDTVFNKSTENKGSRTVTSYTRGLLDATAGTFMRPADKVPNVYTHIVLEMYEEEMQRTFILGTSIETDSSNGFRINRYILENKKISDLSYTYEIDGDIIPYSALELQKQMGVKMLDAKEGVLKFMQRTGLRLNEQQMIAFRRKLRSIMSYDPDAKIDQFIRESVLEEKKVDFSKLIEAKNNIDNLKATFDRIETEIKELEEILQLFEQLQNAENVILADDVKHAYKSMLKSKKELQDAKQNMEIAKRQIAEDEEKLEIVEKKENELRMSLQNAKDSLKEMDCAKAIQIVQKRLEEVSVKKVQLLKEKQQLLDFQNRVSELLAWFFEEKITVRYANVLSSLTNSDYTAAQKASSVDLLFTMIKQCRDSVFLDIKTLNEQLEKNRIQQARQQKIIDDCNANKTTFLDIPDYVSLKNEINNEFAKKGILSEAKFACEYVIGLTDESWRDAIEAYLGKRRYTILVEPEYYDIADDVFNASSNRRAHLFNTKLLMKKEIIPEVDSVVQYFEVKNPFAKKYFDYQLGHLHAVEKEQVREYENAISKDGRVSVAMDSFFLQFDKLRFYCLGQETIELNKIRAQKSIENLITLYKEVNERLKKEEEKKLYLETVQYFFKDFNYDACKMFDIVMMQYEKLKEEVKLLEDAQKSNMEYMALVSQVEKISDELESVKNERKEAYDSKSKMQTQYDLSEQEMLAQKGRIAYHEEDLEKYAILNFNVYRKAIEDYERYIVNGSESTGGTLKDRGRAERALREARMKLTSAQSSYNVRRGSDNHLPITEDSRADYEMRKSRIWMDDLQEIQKNLKEQTRKYEETFKNEFVLTVLKFCEAARDDLKLINAELARLKFKSKYEFSVKYVKDGSDYEKILDYAHYLKEREELGVARGQLTFDSIKLYSDEKGEELENDIRKIISRIVESNEKEQIEHFADYRNYMNYEILLTNEVLNKAKLSKQSGYNSGAEVQIPYMLILLSALLMIYNEKLNSTRIVFIDEPFAKMDPMNVKIMLGFMKSQKLQMIFCAPDKIEVIGNECDVILPVLRTQPDLMEIGIIEMHKGV